MKSTWIAIRPVFSLTLLTGVAYPLGMTGIGKVFFKEKAEGSLVRVKGEVIGSDLIGQGFQDPAYFWPRPSAVDYNPLPSGGSNFAPTSADLFKKMSERRVRWEEGVNDSETKIPDELLFASGSGLDPHLSPEGALFQLARIQGARHWLPEQTERFRKEIERMTQGRALGIIGENTVSVLRLNLALQTFK